MSAEELPPVTICVLTYGDHPDLARKSIGSILGKLDRAQFQLVVGANAVCAETDAYLESLLATGGIDRLEKSPENINKCPMMRRMFEGIETEFIWWFDDDSYVEDSSALDSYLDAARSAPDRIVMWGLLMMIYKGFGSEFASRFVRTASWYGHLTPPSWKVGGKGEMDFHGEGTGDGRWVFVVGGCWLIRTSAIRALDWPDRRLVKESDDVYLGEAIRQQGWEMAHLDAAVAINQSERRGCPGLMDPDLV